MGIIRNPTPEELMPDAQGERLNPISTQRGKVKSPYAKFNDILAKKQVECSEKGLPFAFHVAMDDYKDEMERQIKMSVRKNGYVNPADIKIPEIKLDKYYDLKNFELVEDKDVRDEHIEKKYGLPGLHIKTKVYKYKGYNKTYRVMEDPLLAVERVKKERAENMELVSGKK